MPVLTVSKKQTNIPLPITTELDPEKATQFYEEGFVRLGTILTQTQVQILCETINKIMLGKIQYPDMLMQRDSPTGEYKDQPKQTNGFKGATKNYRKIQNLEKDPKFLSYLKSPILESISKRLIGPEVSIFRTMFMNKPARRGTFLPWHQDGGEIWDLNGGHPKVTVWLALDKATKENGCVQIIPKSHKVGLLSDFGHTITREQEKEYCSDNKKVFLELKAGEAVILHNWTLHASDINRSPHPRRALSVCLMDSRIKSNKPGSPPFPKLFGNGAMESKEGEH